MEDSRQASFFDLFTDHRTAPTMPTAVICAKSKQKTTVASADSATAVLTEPTFVSPAQREMMEKSRYAFYFRGKTFDQIQKIHQKLSPEFYRKSRQSPEGERNLTEWYRCMWSAETIALEDTYRQIDERFLEPQTGEFWLIGKNRIKVGYTYDPCLCFNSQSRLAIPSPHFVFRTDEPSAISETGYCSHFLTLIPYWAVTSLEDLLTQIVATHFKIKKRVSFAPEK